jgi:outer membrane protein assembly factor BamD (BamD/ComL family)
MFTAVLAFALACTCGGALEADDVNLVPGAAIKQAIGGRVKGQVQSESPSEVVVQLGATTTTVPTDLIQSIRYDGQSASFQLAESREAGGQLAEAADLFKKAATESAGKPFPVQAAQFREAQVLTDLAMVEPDRMKEAKDKLTRFLRAYPASRHVVGARLCLARLQLYANDFAGAEAAIAELSKLPIAAERAAVLRTKVLAKQGKHQAAVAELDRLIATYPKGSARQRAAQLAKAESLAGMKQFKESETLLREVIQANPPEDALAQAPAYNTLGDCLRAANRPKDALIAYLHTDLLYSKDKEEHPRALHQIAALFRQLKQDGRADEFAQRLKQEYPRSPWAAGKTASERGE